ncbi:MAG: response regulator transcription factor [Firmicutes bacterium]|nr:response regulator transcription factor [Bacillota bacterium]
MSASDPIAVMIVDDQAMIRQGLAYIISSQDDLRVVAEARDGDEAVTKACTCNPDVILMDIRMPGRHGIAATRAILAAGSAARVVLLTTFDDEQNVFDGIRAGAVGYLLKDADAADLLEAIRAAARGEAVYRTPTAARVVARALSASVVEPEASHATPPREATPLATYSDGEIESLTEREVEVLQQMAYGKRNTEIATVLCVSEGTVKTHVHRILQKLGVEDRTQAVILAIRLGLVD